MDKDRGDSDEFQENTRVQRAAVLERSRIRPQCPPQSIRIETYVETDDVAQRAAVGVDARVNINQQHHLYFGN